MIDLEAIKARCEAATITEAPNYFVSRAGEVWSSGTNWRGYGQRPLIAVDNGKGYLKVRLSIEGRRVNRPVHSLVAQAFLPPRPSPLHEVRHRDGNPHHNCASNLTWGTRKDNADDREKHGRTARGEQNGFASLTTAGVLSIRRLLAEGLSQRAVARRTGVSQRTVGRVASGEGWSHVA